MQIHPCLLGFIAFLEVFLHMFLPLYMMLIWFHDQVRVWEGQAHPPEMFLPKQCLAVLAEFTFSHYITSFWICNNMALQHAGKKGSALKNATEWRLRKQVQTPSCWKHKQYEVGGGGQNYHSPHVLTACSNHNAGIISQHWIFVLFPSFPYCQSLWQSAGQSDTMMNHSRHWVFSWLSDDLSRLCHLKMPQD